MAFKHKTSDIQETNNKKFLTDKEREIVENINQYNSSNHSFTKSISLNNTKELIIPRINIEGNTYHNILDMGTGIRYTTYSLTTKEVELLYSNKDFITFRNKTRTGGVLLWINPGNIVDNIKPSTDYTLILDYYCDREITRFNTQLLGHDTNNPNSNSVSTNINKRSGRAFINIRTNANIDKANPKMACIYMHVYVNNLSANDFFYFGNAKLFEGIYNEGNYTPNGRIDGITGVGDKSRNLFNPKAAKRSILNVDTGVIYEKSDDYIISEFIPVDSGAQYVLYDELGDCANSRYILEYDGSKTFIKSTRIEFPKFGRRKRIVLSSTTKFVIVRFWSADTVHGINIRPQFSPYTNIMFRKDEYHTCVFEPYYDGYKITLRSNNANIFDSNNLTLGNLRGIDGYAYTNIYDIVQGDIIPDIAYGMVCSKNLIKVKPNTSYKIRRLEDHGLNIKVEKIVFYDENGRSACGFNDIYSQQNVHAPNADFRTHSNVIYIRLVFFAHDNRVITESDVQKCKFVISEIETEETNKSDKCEIYLDEPLLKLPNGIKDEIKDGYLIRRIGKKILNGSEAWYISDNKEYSKYAELVLEDCKEGSKILCNDLVVRADTTNDKVSAYNNTLGIMATLGGFIRIRHQVGIESASTVKEWLKNNNVTVYYALKNPIITKINHGGLMIYNNFTELYTDTNLASVKQFTLPGNMNSRISANKDRLMSLKERMNKIEQISLTSVLNAIDLKDGEDNEV